MQQSNEAVCVFDTTGNIEYANTSFCNNVRLISDDIIGRSTLPFWDWESEAYISLTESLQQALSWSGRHAGWRHRP